MRHISRWLAIPYILWMLIFIIIPVLLLCYFSFVDRNGHFSLENYQQFFTMRYMYMLGESILYAAIITAVCLMISYPAAYFIRQSKHAATWLLVMIIPTWMNLLLKTYAFIGIFSQDGLINRFMTALHLPSQSLLFTAPAFIIVSAYIYIPFMLLPIYNSMKDINNQLFYAAQDLGANTFTTMQKVLLPLSKEGIKTGITSYIYPSTVFIYDYAFNCR